MISNGYPSEAAERSDGTSAPLRGFTGVYATIDFRILM